MSPFRAQSLRRVQRRGTLWFNGAFHHCELFFGGDLPWLKRLLGISTHAGVMSVHSRGIYVSAKTGWVGKGLERTLQSDKIACRVYQLVILHSFCFHLFQRFKWNF